MRDPVRAALVADAKAWSLGLVIIVLYLTLGDSHRQVLTDPVEESDLYTRPVTMADHGFHNVSQ